MQVLSLRNCFSIIDAHSKCIDAYPVNYCTSLTIIKKLRQSFAIHGLSEALVSDNGSCFISVEFSEFMQQNGIKHIKSVPNHPSINGSAERTVQSLKQGFKKMSTGTIEICLVHFLSFELLLRPQVSFTADLLFNRKMITRLDLVQPNMERQIKQKQLCRSWIMIIRRSEGCIAGDLVYVKTSHWDLSGCLALLSRWQDPYHTLFKFLIGEC